MSQPDHDAARLEHLNREGQLRALALVLGLASVALGSGAAFTAYQSALVGSGTALYVGPVAAVASLLYGPLLALAAWWTWRLDSRAQVGLLIACVALLPLAPFGTLLGLYGIALALTGGGPEVLGAYWYRDAWLSSDRPTPFRPLTFLVPAALVGALLVQFTADWESTHPSTRASQDALLGVP